MGYLANTDWNSLMKYLWYWVNLVANTIIKVNYEIVHSYLCLCYSYKFKKAMFK